MVAKKLSSHRRQIFFSLIQKYMEETQHQQEDLERQQMQRRKSFYRPERAKLQRKKTLVASGKTRYADNFVRHHDTAFVHDGDGSDSENNEDELWNPWESYVDVVTCCFPRFCLDRCVSGDKRQQRAWREKMALISIILFSWIILGFITILMQFILCDDIAVRYDLKQPPDYEAWAIKGRWYRAPDSFLQSTHGGSIDYIDAFRKAGYRDVTPMFLNSFKSPSCTGYNLTPYRNCSIVGGFNGVCHKITDSDLEDGYMRLEVSFEWPEIRKSGSNLLVHNGIVMDMSRYLGGSQKIFGDEVHQAIIGGLGNDATQLFTRSNSLIKAANCMTEEYIVGYVSNVSSGCFATDMINIMLFFMVLGLLVARLSMAVIYAWFVAPKLSRKPDLAKTYISPGLDHLTKDVPNRNSLLQPSLQRSSAHVQNKKLSKLSSNVDMNELYASYVVCLVTCYSEDEPGIRATLESLASTEYSDRQKLIFIVADGLVTGNGNSRSTPEICKSLLTLDDLDDPEPRRYVAIADGSKQLNMAQVYSGHFKYQNHSVPAILVVKCGTPEEQGKTKPGNRGKRDSQVILMNFFSKLMFDDRLTELEYDLLAKMKRVSGVAPERFEIVVMVDADTIVYSDSLPKMVNAMKNNTAIMGLCGETRIANKFSSWVTGIQVYEYFISHHLFKNFESLFGGVTCLPGCFSAYRIKAPKENGFWVPILASPDIIEEYSQNVVETLHQKNLLLLGEDRFLTTLMLKTFPKRQMIFLPQAVCKTMVPDSFKVLLSQRRRWINSTIHNLMELVLVKDLCGTFCFSMQFVVALELIGTILLPAALLFTIALVVVNFADLASQLIVPLIMLASTLFLPPLVLVLFTSRRPSYILWLFVYILALPIWNVVLPLYSFYHFDDFTWGETRKIQGDIKGVEDQHQNDREKFESSKIIMKKRSQWERESRTPSIRTEDNSNYSEDTQDETVSIPLSTDISTDDEFCLPKRLSNLLEDGSSSTVREFPPRKLRRGLHSSSSIMRDL